MQTSQKNIELKEVSILDQFQGFLETRDISPVSHYNSNLKQFRIPEISISNDLILELQELDHPRNKVLGKRMESFFGIAVKYSKRYELISSNLQIIKEKITLGELDFLIFDKMTKKYLHVELVYKLYLYDPEFPSEKERWIGPNRRDSFSEKLNKLETKQFPLLKRPEASSFLKNLNLEPDEIEQQLCFKARLFTPEVQNSQSIAGPVECISGNYYRYAEFREKAWKGNLFYTPKKKYWSAVPQANSEWFEYEELLKRIKELFDNHKSPMIWMKTGNSFQSFFVVWW